MLQRDQACRFWGWADKGEEITVSFRDQKLTVKAGDDGKWSTKLAPLSLGEPGTLTVQGTNKIELTDVLVARSGSVPVSRTCSGPCSRLSIPIWKLQPPVSRDPPFQVPQTIAHEPQDDVPAQWKACTPENIPNFSAVAYFFGRQLHETLDVPVGIIQTAWGGTPAEAWTRYDHLDADDDFQADHRHVGRSGQNYNEDDVKAKHAAALEKWKAAVAKAKEEGKQPPQRPPRSTGPQGQPALPVRAVQRHDRATDSVRHQGRDLVSG